MSKINRQMAEEVLPRNYFISDGTYIAWKQDLDNLTAALSSGKLVVPASEEEISHTVFEYLNTHGYNLEERKLRNGLTKALLGKVPKPAEDKPEAREIEELKAELNPDGSVYTNKYGTVTMKNVCDEIDELVQVVNRLRAERK